MVLITQKCIKIDIRGSCFAKISRGLTTEPPVCVEGEGQGDGTVNAAWPIVRMSNTEEEEKRGEGVLPGCWEAGWTPLGGAHWCKHVSVLISRGEGWFHLLLSLMSGPLSVTVTLNSYGTVAARKTVSTPLDRVI